MHKHQQIHFFFGENFCRMFEVNTETFNYISSHNGAILFHFFDKEVISQVKLSIVYET